ncbi:MAG: LysM peptidoglycan-binding domain-containing protein [Panacagrimonas sp.]
MTRLSPQVRELPIQVPTPTIPIDAIRAFMNGPRLISGDELARAPYVSALANERLVSGSGDEVYVQDLPANGAVSYSVVRRGEPYRDPDSGEALGYEAVPVAEGDVRSFGAPGTVVLAKASREARVGDRLIAPEPPVTLENLRPHVPSSPVGGKIIGITDGFARVGQYQVVALNRGSRHGLEAGHVLDILHGVQAVPGQAAVTIPQTRSGQLLVFKVASGFSYALVMSATQPIYKYDRVEIPALDRP